MTTGRTSILEALATVPGLIPTETTPTAPTPGAAWPRWTGATFAGKLHRVMVNTYDVLVVLPAGTNEITVESADGMVEEIADALNKIGTVESCQPVALTFDEGTAMPGLQFRCTPVVC